MACWFVCLSRIMYLTQVHSDPGWFWALMEGSSLLTGITSRKVSSVTLIGFWAVSLYLRTIINKHWNRTQMNEFSPLFVWIWLLIRASSYLLGKEGQWVYWTFKCCDKKNTCHRLPPNCVNQSLFSFASLECYVSFFVFVLVFYLLGDMDNNNTYFWKLGPSQKAKIKTISTFRVNKVLNSVRWLLTCF